MSFVLAAHRAVPAVEQARHRPTSVWFGYRSMTEIITNLFVGTREDAAALGTIVPDGWTVISVTEYRARYGRSEELPAEPQGALDLPFMRSGRVDPYVLDAISEVIASRLRVGDRVLVHCVHAQERSPLAIVWHLVRVGLAPSIEAAYDAVRTKHPTTEIRTPWLRGALPG